MTGHFFFYATIMQNWQKVLGVTSTDTMNTITKKYRTLALRMHPNKGGTTQGFQNLQAAYQQSKKYHSRMHPSSNTTLNVKIIFTSSDKRPVFVTLPRITTIMSLYHTVSQKLGLTRAFVLSWGVGYDEDVDEDEDARGDPRGDPSIHWRRPRMRIKTPGIIHIDTRVSVHELGFFHPTGDRFYRARSPRRSRKSLNHSIQSQTATRWKPKSGPIYVSKRGNVFGVIGGKVRKPVVSSKPGRIT